MHINRDELHHALMDLVSVMTRPQPDQRLLAEAGVQLDRALFPLLVRIGLYGPVGVVDLAEMVGRDHSTVSRQLARLAEQGLIERSCASRDQRVRTAVATQAGREMVAAIGAARRRLYAKVLAGWSEADKAALTRLLRRFADDMDRTLVWPPPKDEPAPPAPDTGRGV
ncbi:MarR family transcriptional regulator [Pseudoxanthobacter sp.]|uniref:MarR family winged helix-turn-helix transcriptional regulator n=1 Tax=Pseudoxanthobacter sp. TaxID=1925742 RepID=UPI002FE162FF